MNGARYHSITLELDPMASDGTYQLKFSTTPGMSTSITGKAPRKPRRSRRGGMALPGRFLV